MNTADMRERYDERVRSIATQVRELASDLAERVGLTPAQVVVDVASMVDVSVLRAYDRSSIAEANPAVDTEGLATAYGDTRVNDLVERFCAHVTETLVSVCDIDYAGALDAAACDLAMDLGRRDVADANLGPDDHIGTTRLARVLDVTDELVAEAGPIAPYTDCYRINDMGDYVTEAAWDRVWSSYPDWYHKVWMITGNGQYTFDDVAAMTLAEALAAFDDPNFYPEYTFFTDSGEEGIG